MEKLLPEFRWRILGSVGRGAYALRLLGVFFFFLSLYAFAPNGALGHEAGRLPSSQHK